MLEAAHELGILYGMIGSIQGLGVAGRAATRANDARGALPGTVGGGRVRWAYAVYRPPDGSCVQKTSVMRGVKGHT